jgi:hypothetical protein
MKEKEICKKCGRQSEVVDLENECPFCSSPPPDIEAYIKDFREHYGERAKKGKGDFWLPEYATSSLESFLRHVLTEYGEKEYERGRFNYQERATPILEVIARGEGYSAAIDDAIATVKKNGNTYDGDERLVYDTTIAEVITALQSLKQPPKE